MAEASVIARHEGNFIIGHDIPGLSSPVILMANKDHLLGIIRKVDSGKLPRARGKSVDELRDFIKEELTTNTYPLPNRKVSYAAV